jgi:hypothetical protein
VEQPFGITPAELMMVSYNTDNHGKGVTFRVPSCRGSCVCALEPWRKKASDQVREGVGLILFSHHGASLVGPALKRAPMDW